LAVGGDEFAVTRALGEGGEDFHVDGVVVDEEEG
jgi:hypothetical protein